jgi:hypothetical protein
MGGAEDAGQQPHASSARVKPGEKGQPTRAAVPDGTSAACPADTGEEEPGRPSSFVPVTEADVAALEESVWKDDYDRGQQQAIAGNLARREEDRELIARLAKSNFEGPGQDLFEAELAAYGYPVMMAWTRTGEIIRKTKEKGRPLRIPCDGPGWSREDRSELSSETVARALVFFREKVLRAGAWDYTHGATIKTYFVGACLFQFPNVYQAWQGERQRWNRRPTVSADDPDGPDMLYQVPSDDDTEHRAIARHKLQQVMAELAGKHPDLYRVVQMWLEGHTDAQAAEKLGSTPRKIEGQWRRYRRGHSGDIVEGGQHE